MLDANFDRDHIIHPYSACPFGNANYLPPVLIESAQGVYLTTATGERLIDGMSSWWSAVHGYNHPHLNAAIHTQLGKMAHVMFGGLTHKPAIDLARAILALSPAGMDAVFFADSGSVAMEAALKLAIQYWHSQQKGDKQQFISLRHGYHGDTMGVMSISDPHNGMHQVFANSLLRQIHVGAPPMLHELNHEQKLQAALAELKQTIADNAKRTAALVLEPLVQGAGGMRFYDVRYLQAARAYCDEYEILLIADEIATGFGRIGSYFACSKAGISPDIMAIGKALTGGYMTLAACVLNGKINRAIGSAPPYVFMHGPTFMANPLACSVALASLELLPAYLQLSAGENRIMQLENRMRQILQVCAHMQGVADVRVCGAIAVIELVQAVDMQKLVPILLAQQIWLRPFGKLVYIMPAFCISERELQRLCEGIVAALSEYLG